MSVLIKLDKFEGSLDLLCHLILKNKMDIFDIDIIKIVNIYIYYLENSNYSDLDTASDFVSMASHLLYIKSISLLPKTNEAQKLKEDLVGQLIDYTICKEIANKLKEQSDGIYRYTRDSLKLDIDLRYENEEDILKLLKAYQSILMKTNPEEINKTNFDNYIKHHYISVNDKISYLIDILKKKEKLYFSEIFNKSKSENIAIFLALLELLKENKIHFENIIEG